MAPGGSEKARILMAAFVFMLVGTCGSSFSEGAAPKGATMSPPQEEVRQKTRGTTCNGALFEMVADRVWRIPAPGDGAGSVVELALRITNLTKTPLRFNRFDTLRLALFAPDGRAVPFEGGRNATRPGEAVSPPLLPGEALVISRQRRLIPLKNGGLRLIGSEEFGGIWYFDGLGPGRYKVQCIYGNLVSGIGDVNAVWVGEAATPLQEVELR